MPQYTDKIYRKKIIIDIPKSSRPYNWGYNLAHYVFQPWVVEGKTLGRLYKTPSGNYVLLKLGFKDNKLIVNLYSHKNIVKEDVNWFTDTIKFMFGVNESVSEFYDVICQKDPVLKAAAKNIYGAHLRRDADVFESIIGVTVAQNVFFKRIYRMLELLCKKFGVREKFNGKIYYTFPAPEKIASADLSEIRKCTVGYRDIYIKGVAEKIVNEHLDLNKLREENDLEKIRSKLIEFPGVGPYTADLAISIAFYIPSFHLDLFTREALYTFYFKGKKVSDDKLRIFVNKRWAKWKHYVMLLLTTNTDEWAKDLGVEFRLKSAARNE
jgi:3-methyladenine DNA glycosylase/8-oxoguanine DNA glycosylase